MKIARIVFDVDMRCNFEGIREQLKKKEKIEVDTLSKDYVVICFNRRATCFKMLIDNAYIVYYKNGNRRIPLEAIQFLPQRFGGSEAEFNKAVEKSIRAKLGVFDKPTSKVIRRRPAAQDEARP